MSITRPASASEFGPKATNPMGMSSSKVGSSTRTGNLPAGPSWPKTTSPLKSRRRAADEVLELCGRHARHAEGVEQHVDAPTQPEREPASGEAVHSRRVGGRHGRMPGVVVRRRRGDAERAGGGSRRARQRHRFLDVEPLGDERAPEAERLTGRHLVQQFGRRLRRPGEDVEAQLVQLRRLAAGRVTVQF